MLQLSTYRACALLTCVECSSGRASTCSMETRPSAKLSRLRCNSCTPITRIPWFTLRRSDALCSRRLRTNCVLVAHPPSGTAPLRDERFQSILMRTVPFFRSRNPPRSLLRPLHPANDGHVLLVCFPCHAIHRRRIQSLSRPPLGRQRLPLSIGTCRVLPTPRLLPDPRLCHPMKVPLRAPRSCPP